MNNVLRKSHGLILLTVITATLLMIFYGKIILSPGEVFFAPWGDGLKSAYGSYYHYEYDSAYMQTYSMNYPYGESVFFTGNQPIVVNLLKLLSRLGFDFSENLIGILNIWLIITVLLGVICIYLLLVEFGLPVLYAILVSLIISFLSPQIERFSGHYDLAYLFIIPLLILLLYKYYKSPGMLRSLITGLVVFISMYIHGYYYAFFSIWVIVMLTILYFTDKERFPLFKTTIHFLLMVVLPFLIFTIVTKDAISDRTAYPWGAIGSAAFLKSVFLPVYTNYCNFLKIADKISYYIGLTSTIFFLILLFTYIKGLKKSERRWLIVDNKFLNALLIGSIIALLYSFALPFKVSIGKPVNFNLYFLLNYAGPIRQFRGTGRFSWMFFYTINIITYYYLYYWFINNKTKIKTLFFFLILLFGVFEAYDNIKNRGTQFNNRLEELTDYENLLPQNNWVNKISIQQFQAILPLPFFHIGSENFWISRGEEIQRLAFGAAWKTGLPLMSVQLSRTSLEQTLKSIGMVLEPLKPYRIMDDMPSSKDLLILRAKDKSLTVNENRLLKSSIPIYEDDLLGCYALPIDTLKKLQQLYREKIINTVCLNTLADSFTFRSPSDSLFIYKSFGNKFPEPFHSSTGMEKARRKYVLIDTMLFSTHDSLTFSVWIKGMNVDLIPRGKIELQFYKDNVCLQSINKMISERIVFIDENGWGLFEISFKPEETADRISAKIFNRYTTGQINEVDDILLLPKNSDLYFKSNDFYYWNNRYLFP